MHRSQLFMRSSVTLLIFLIGCYGTGQNRNSRTKVSELQEPKTDKYPELTGVIEEFTEDVGERGQAAWNKLQEYPRKDLTDYLLQQQNTLSRDDPLNPKIAFVLCNFDYEYDRNKQILTG